MHRAIGMLVLAVQAMHAMAASPTIQVRQAGIGDVLPVGRPAGIEISVDPGNLESANYLLEWETPTPDGDTLVRSKTIALAGRPIRTWIYGTVPSDEIRPMPIRLRAADSLTVFAETTLDGSNTGGVLPEGADFMLVLGDRTCGLETYDLRSLSGTSPWSMIHTTVRTIAPSDVPENAHALAAASTLLITGDPSSLEPNQLAAIRTWMESGGHVIIAFPATADPWGLDADQGPWHDLLPHDSVATTIRLRDLVAVLSPDPLETLEPIQLPIRLFPSARAINNPWHVIVESPQGDVLGIARPIGHGRLTLLGLDVSSPAMLRFALDGDAIGPLPAASTFWNAVLSRRGDAPTHRQLRLAQEEGLLLPPLVDHVQLTDAIIGGGIRQTVAAGGRLLLVLAWLGLYLVLAGPVLWWVLRRLNRPTLSWPLFGVLGAAGGICAWLIASVMSLQAVEGMHISVIDEVANWPVQRVRTWVDLQLPGTGQRTLQVREVEGLPARINTWSERGRDDVGFMDTRVLRTDAASLNNVPVQARATSLSVEVERLGYPETDGPSLRLVTPLSVTRTAEGKPQLTGAIQNELSTPLLNVSIVWINARLQPTRKTPKPWTDSADSGAMPAQGWSWKLSGPLQPGAILDFSTIGAPTKAESLAVQLDMLGRVHGRAFGTSASSNARRAALEALGLYRLSTPPPWQAVKEGTIDPPWLVQRHFGAGLDLGAQLGSPMLLVSGFIKEAALPIPLYMDGTRIVLPRGETMLRWTTPLPDVPSRLQ
ncbi:MAG: DUF4350 domain-containing protein [Phycisphaerales bacterium]|nr:DUF4350 domain-containing protein [Phycisphaerales bacterium]